jgi:hypothetical protein
MPQLFPLCLPQYQMAVVDRAGGAVTNVTSWQLRQQARYSNLARLSALNQQACRDLLEGFRLRLSIVSNDPNIDLVIGTLQESVLFVGATQNSDTKVRYVAKFGNEDLLSKNLCCSTLLILGLSACRESDPYTGVAIPPAYETSAMSMPVPSLGCLICGSRQQIRNAQPCAKQRIDSSKMLPARSGCLMKMLPIKSQYSGYQNREAFELGNQARTDRRDCGALSRRRTDGKKANPR